MDFIGKKIAVFGVTGSGKTYFVRRLLRFFSAPFVYTVHKEDFSATEDNAYIYIPKPENAVSDFEQVVRKVLELARERKVDALIVDEADMFMQTNWDLSPVLHDAVINHRHYNLALVFISRRPQDIPTKFVEGCHYTFIFKLEGHNAIQKFREVDPEILPLLSRVEFSKHNFVVKEIGIKPYLNTAIS